MKLKKRQIVFLEPFPTVMLYKIAKLFREKGYETVLIKLLKCEGASNEFHTAAFDKIISFELNFFKISLKNLPMMFMFLITQFRDLLKASFLCFKLKPYAVIARSSSNWPIAIARILVRKAPFIYFPYDIRAQTFDSYERAKKLWGVPWFEIKAERFCFESADGLIHKGRPDELEFLEGRSIGTNIKFPKIQINIFPYSSKEFMVPINKNKLSKKDNELHLVYVGSMGTVGPSGAEYVFDNIYHFIKQGIHVHLYTRPNSVSKDKVKEFFEEDSGFTRKYKDILESKYFHLHVPLEPDELAAGISQYDFGFWPSPVKSDYDIEPTMAMGNKLSSYIEAGIPFICSKINDFIVKVGEDYGVVFSYDLTNEEEMKNLKKNLDKIDKKKLAEDMKYAREDFLMEKHFPRFEKFVKKVVENKKK
jgi:hypothetical protein